MRDKWEACQGIYGWYVYDKETNETYKIPPQTEKVANIIARSFNLAEHFDPQTLFDLEAFRRAAGS